MFIEEAAWIRSALERLPLAPGASVLDVGSSTAEFRERVQPHIHEEIFRPLEERQLEVVHLDAKDGEGVDVICDLTSSASRVRETLNRTFDVVLCCNLLEHVVDRSVVVDAVAELVSPGRWLITTVPQQYRVHHDPIDTMYRPLPAELSSLFVAGGSFRELEATTVRVDQRRYYRPYPPASLRSRARDAARWAIPSQRWRQSCVVLQSVG